MLSYFKPNASRNFRSVLVPFVVLLLHFSLVRAEDFPPLRLSASVGNIIRGFWIGVTDIIQFL